MKWLRFACALSCTAIALVVGAKTAHAADPVESECAAGWEESVYAGAVSSIVRVRRPDGGQGAGFFFGDTRHIVTSQHVVDLGREILVYSHGGERRKARIAAHDADRDLALLVVEEAFEGARPLTLRAEVPIGAPVLAIGHPYADPAADITWQGLFSFSAQRGIVSAVNGHYIQTDAQVGPGNSGGPLLTCDGRVVGVLSFLVDNRVAFAVRSPFIAMLRGAEKQAPYRGEWQLRDISLGLLLHADVEDWAGAYLGLGVIGHDRYVMHLRVGGSFGLGRNTGDAIVSRSRTRGALELTTGYRFLLFPYSFPTYLTLTAGAAGALDRGEERRLVVAYDRPECPDAPMCRPTLVSERTALRGGGVMPMLGLDVKLLAIELGYAFQLDVVSPKLSTQRVIAGVTF